MFGEGKLVREFETRIIPLLPEPQEGSHKVLEILQLVCTVLKVTDWEKGSFSC